MAIIDARTLPNATEIEADLVIIGGGMAGIAIAREWAGAERSVAILESGGLDADAAAQDLYRGAGTMRAPGNDDRAIDDYLHQSRFRGLGGSGNIWGGKCVPLDASDFLHREWVGLSGWPMTRETLQPFYDRACDMLEIARFDRPFSDPERPPLRLDGETCFFSAPRRFTRLSGAVDAEAFNRFRTGFADADNVSVYLNANVTALRRGGRGLRGLDVACLDGRRHRARGRAYLLATGGIENVRLMLASGFGDASDYLGRCFQGHVTFGVYDNPDGLNSSLCVSQPDQSMALYTQQGRDITHCVLAATLEGQRRHRIGNCTVTMADAPVPAAAEAPAIFRMARLADHGPGEGVGRNLPLFVMSEHQPNRESRIVLDEANVDALGMPRVRLEWSYSEADLAALEGAVRAIAVELGAAGAGRFCWPIERGDLLRSLNASRHHMGTTRMSGDASEGVVDGDCRVHGCRNFYVAGSSVFPTSGIANPTLTLMALAIRLSDHLKRDMGVRT